jgi:hypothetical protein
MLEQDRALRSMHKPFPLAHTAGPELILSKIEERSLHLMFVSGWHGRLLQTHNLITSETFHHAHPQPSISRII